MEWEDFLKQINKLAIGKIIYLSDFEENQRGDVQRYLTLLNRLGCVSQEGIDDPLMEKLEAYRKVRIVPNVSFEKLEDDLDALEYFQDYDVLTGCSHVNAIDAIYCKCSVCKDPDNCYGRKLITGRIIREISKTFQNSPK